MNIILSEEQQDCLNLILEWKNLLISGKGGTGKSLLIKRIKETFGDEVNVTASTGLAALNIGGTTVHSFSGIYDTSFSEEHVAKYMMSVARERILRCKRLIIDEVSMVSDKLLDFLDNLYRIVRQDDSPFGGIQLILFGDFLQLPPVCKDGERFCFMARAFRESNFTTKLLCKNFRQKEKDFNDLLDRLRYGELNESDRRVLESRNNIHVKEDLNPVFLFSNNSEVDMKNYNFYTRIDSEEKVFERKEMGDEKTINFLKKNSPSKPLVKLKVNTQVMLMDNRLSSINLVNGSVGRIVGFCSLKEYLRTKVNEQATDTSLYYCYKNAVDLSEELDGSLDLIPLVKFPDNLEPIAIPYNVWSRDKVQKNFQGIEEKIELGRFIQLPLRQSWAITIHKSQGMTLDAIVCDLSKIFSEGQAYVALSRVKTLEGLYINNLNFNRIRANKDIVNYYKNVERRLKVN